MKINDIVNMLIAARKVKTSTLASELGITRQTLYRFLRSESSISHDKLLKILDYFDFDVTEMAKRRLIGLKSLPSRSEVSSDINILLDYIDEFQRSYQIDYLVKLCKKELEKRPDPKIEQSIERVSEYYLGDGR